MIKINYLNPIPKNMDSSTIEYRRVLIKNIQIFRQRASLATFSFDFSGYENQSNKKNLRGLTKGRCAYCGVRVTGVSQLEIEHYRPKKRVDIRDSEFILNKKSNYSVAPSNIGVVECGYFYHGNDYRNLLPSCSVCNKGINGGVVVVGKKLVYNMPFGKKNFFPVKFIKKEGVRVDPRIGKGAIMNIKDEKPLLYNPYIDDPMTLFSYKQKINIEGSFYIKVSAKKKLSRYKKLLANISINLLGLNRIELCSKRHDIMQGLVNLQRNILADIHSNNRNINIWAHHAIICANYFDEQQGELIGFARVIGRRLPNFLRAQLLARFNAVSLGVLTNNEDFNVLIKELKEFGGNNYNEDEYSDINEIIDGLIIL